MQLYVSTAELKAYLGISGSSQDTLLAMLNKQATAMVNGILSVSDLALHSVTDEVHDAVGEYLRLKDLHVGQIVKIMDDDTEYTQDVAYDIDNYVVHLEDYLTGGFRKAKVSYLAGWNASAMATITVSDYAALAAAATITLGAVSADGFTITRGTDWTAGTSNETEATKIAVALDAKAGVRSFAIGAVVYVIEDTNPQIATRSLATSDAVRLTASASTLGGIDFPEDIRGAVMTLVSSMSSMRKNPRMKSYTIGTKTVSFATDAEFQSFKQYLAPYMRVKISAV